LLNLFFIFFKLGIFTFGGGYAMIPLIKEELVKKKAWMTEGELLNIIAIAESTPGPIAINIATHIGYQQKGFWGSLFATLGVVIPSFTIIFIISLFFENMLENKIVEYAFTGIKCAVAILIFKTGIEMLVKIKKTVFNVSVFMIVFIGMILVDIFVVDMSSILFILLGGTLSLIIYSLKVQKREEKKK